VGKRTYEKTCEHCGKTFIGVHDKLYCSKECRSRHATQREADLMEEHVESARVALSAAGWPVRDLIAMAVGPAHRRNGETFGHLAGRTCSVCGRTFDATSARQKCCCQECRMKAELEQRRMTQTNADLSASAALASLPRHERERLANLFRKAAEKGQDMETEATEEHAEPEGVA